ncbi:hypothetical protein J8L73_18460 [Pseudoalteromonas sp. MMG006]|uniref:hypothetical protein n=1 Tax=Pseudoalteromonas sp. MMG006 TaxID=2822683 RepID=UPI001B368ACE|nr:hypothetical protein [Pseudoalteromonas sp. MMG006]MBQ4801078.1 hypothetical protein [Pseudoalteromonas sp. MMG006]
MEITLGVMTVIIAALIFALYKAHEIRKADIETLLALNYLEFECLQILVANDGVASKDKFKEYHYKTLNDLAEEYDVLINSDGDVTGTYSNIFLTDRNKKSASYALGNKPKVSPDSELHLLSIRREPTV